MNHYFENNENLKSEIIKISFYFRGKSLEFLSDNGVFSKKSIDFGSSTLLQYVDDLLVFSPQAFSNKDNIHLLKLFALKGCKVSKEKLYFVQYKIWYLGYLILEQGL